MFTIALALFINLLIAIVAYYVVSAENQKLRLNDLANTDQLTGLYNSRYFYAMLGKMAKNNWPFAVYYIDLNKFKAVNDTYGHAVGDKLLIETAKRISNVIREEDAAFRIGGDEFTIILSDSNHFHFYEEMKGRLEDVFAAPFAIDRILLDVTASCGYAQYPRDTTDIEKLIHIADHHMYEEKAHNA